MKKILKSCVKFVRLVKMSNFLSALRIFSLAFLKRDGTVRIKINNCDLLIRLNSPDMSVAISNLGDEFSALYEYLPEDFNGIIVDAGGYIGTAAIKFAQMYPMAKVITVEPSSSNFQVLEENTRNFERIYPINAALTASNKSEVTLSSRGTGHWGYTIIEKPLDMPDANIKEIIGTVTLSEILSRFGEKEIGILKLDIEGGEKEIFVENSAELNNTYAVIAELHDRIVDGCSAAFEDFSRGRHIVKKKKDKRISIKRG